MKSTLSAACAAFLALVFSASTAFAADPVKIGMITTLSTAGGYLGEDVRDGFLLAIDEEGGKLGGVPVRVLVEDDNLKPANGKQIADKFMLQEKVKIFTGIIYTNVALAVIPGLLENNNLYLSPNSGPSLFAGKGCNKNFFGVAWQTDNLFEAPGQYANTLGFKRMALVAPNYPGGKDAITGFKRYYRGAIAEEIYTTLDQSDYSAEIARLRASNADALFYFLPGGLGINFLKQFTQAGLKEKMKVVLPEVSLESRVVEATGNDSVGLFGTAHWVAGLPFPANKKFVDGFRAKYHREPTVYASQGYDTAKLLGSGLKAVNGDVTKMDALRAALKRADFASTRGAFKFGSNQFPIQDWYSTRVVKGKDGKLEIVTVGRILKNLQDVYASSCTLPT